jgi:KDO2-lipid IV(A) lauroyltransferase
MYVFSKLSYPRASDLGGWIGRRVGRFLSMNRRAQNHIALAMPHLSEPQRNIILSDMWENLGRNFAEYPHLSEIAAHHVTVIEGADIMNDLKVMQKSAVIIGAHFGNWEVPAPYFAQCGFDLDLIYRAPNNPFVDQKLESYRNINNRMHNHPKSVKGMLQLIKGLKKGHLSCILIDQKYNEGVSVPFFGHPAMTSYAALDLSRRFDCPLIIGAIQRMPNHKFGIRFEKSFDLNSPAYKNLDNIQILNEIHTIMERFITQRPDHWLWIHRRWG